MKFVFHIQLLLYCFMNSFQDDFFILKPSIVSDKTSYSCATNSSSLTPIDEKTKINGNSNCQPISVLKGLKENFKISFALKLDEEGYIFLCDGKNITQSSCYWFLLQTENGSRTKLRKCPPGNISLQNHHVPFPCSINIDVKRHPEDVPKYLSGRKWSNFELIKHRKSLMLNLVDNKTVLVEVEDIYNAIQVTDMLIYTKRGEGFWKIRQKKNEENFLSVLMLISYCNFCGMRLYLLDLEEEKNYGKIQIWTEIKLSANNTKENDKNDIGNKLFGISGLATCKMEELSLAIEGTYCENIQNKTFCALCFWIHSELNSMKIVKKENRLLLSKETVSDMEEKSFSFQTNETTIIVPLTATAAFLFLLVFSYFCYLYIKYRRKNAQLTEEDILLQISFSKTVKLQEFPDYVKNSLKNGELKRQFTKFQTRVKNANCYSKINDGLSFDYIDLRLSDYVLNKAYLVCEVPKPILFANEFWNTMWLQNVKNMILFDNIIDGDKTNQFWPEMTDKIIYRDVSLQTTFYGFHLHYESRTLLLNKNKQNRTINHYRFNTKWFDNTDSMYQNFVKFLLEVSKIDLTIDSPLLVHSRGGFGGTTFVVLCDMSIRKAIKEDSIDILQNLKYLNDCNQNLTIDSFERFKMAHVAILQYFSDSVHCDLACHVPSCR